MAAPSVTNIFANSTVADADQVNENFSDLIDGASDGTRDYDIASLETSTAGGGSGLVSVGGALATSTARSVPTNGGSTTIAANVSTHIFDPAALIASHTITLPASPVENQRVAIVAGEFGITAVTLAASSGQTIDTNHSITTLLAGTSVEYIMKSNVWYRLNRSDAPTTAPTSGVVESTSNTSSFGSSGAWADVTNATVDITTDGNTPVFVGLTGDRSAADEDITANVQFGAAGTVGQIDVSIVRVTSGNTTEFFNSRLRLNLASVLEVPPGMFWLIDVPPAGTHTYKLRVQTSGASSVFTQSKLVAYKFLPQS